MNKHTTPLLNPCSPKPFIMEHYEEACIGSAVWGVRLLHSVYCSIQDGNINVSLLQLCRADLASLFPAAMGAVAQRGT